MPWVVGKSIKVQRGGQTVMLRPGDLVPEAVGWRNRKLWERSRHIRWIPDPPASGVSVSSPVVVQISRMPTPTPTPKPEPTPTPKPEPKPEPKPKPEQIPKSTKKVVKKKPAKKVVKKKPAKKKVVKK